MAREAYSALVIENIKDGEVDGGVCQTVDFIDLKRSAGMETSELQYEGGG